VWTRLAAAPWVAPPPPFPSWGTRPLIYVVQVCGVFLVLVSGAGAGMYWGLQCYPWLCGSFIAAYILAAALCVVLGQYPVPLSTAVNQAGS